MSNLTKNAIIDSFLKLLAERPFDKITVKDIVEKCGISRRTFYYHYEDIFALLEDVFTLEIDKVINSIGLMTNWQEGFIAATQFIRDNKQAAYHIYHSTHRNEVERYLYKISAGIMEYFVELMSQDLEVDEFDKKLVADFYRFGLSGLFFQWLDTGMKEEPVDVVERIGRMFEGNIRASLERAAAK